jgi:hypothetical protein
LNLRVHTKFQGTGTGIKFRYHFAKFRKHSHFFDIFQYNTIFRKIPFVRTLLGALQFMLCTVPYCVRICLFLWCVFAGLYDIHIQLSGVPILGWHSPPLTATIYASEVAFLYWSMALRAYQSENPEKVPVRYWF